MPLAAVFALFIALLVLSVAACVAAFVPRPYRARAIVGLFVWTPAAGALGASGALASATARPPALLDVFVPTIALVALAARTRAGGAIAASLPIVALTLFQTMRVFVELTLHQLYEAHRLSGLFTFHGGNFDIVIGLTAPVVAFAYAAGRLSPRLLAMWNVLGLISLANVIARGVLTSPLFHIDGNGISSAFATPPYSFIPALIVPLALLLHVLSLRWLGAAARAS